MPDFLVTNNLLIFRDISSWSPRMRASFIELYGEQLFQELWIEWIEAVKHYFNSDRKGMTGLKYISFGSYLLIKIQTVCIE